jgi:CRT-like, chloroquine-resistance transporter-like
LLEPRGALHSITLLHRTTSGTGGSCATAGRSPSHPSDNDTLQIQLRQSSLPLRRTQEQQYEQYFHDEPEIPVHPALEFEIVTTEVKESLHEPLLPQHGIHHTSNGIDDEGFFLTRANVNEDLNNAVNGAMQQRSRVPLRMNHLQFSFACCCLVISGVGIVVFSKLQAIPMYVARVVDLRTQFNTLFRCCCILKCIFYLSSLFSICRYNYPNFLNLYSNLLYLPLCWAYIVPVSRWIRGGSSSSSSSIVSANIDADESSSSKESITPWRWPSALLTWQFAVMGALDAISVTLQTFAAVYLPGPLLILVPQAAIPVSLALTYLAESSTTPSYRRISTSPMQWLGATTVLIGIFLVLEPVWSSRHAPDFYCEAADRSNDCTICQLASTEATCIATTKTMDASFASPTTRPQWLYNESSSSDDYHPSHPDEATTPCQWLPFEDSSQEKELLEGIWSILLMVSSIPMALSAMYKQRVIHTLSSMPVLSVQSIELSNEQSLNAAPSSPVLFVSGWIAVFQLLFSIVLAIPAGSMSSPSVQPWNVTQNLWNGMFCYAGHGVIETGCHPDSMCASYNVAIWVNLGVLCHAVYTISVMLVLQGSNTCVPLFLALTATVPLGHFAFTMSFLPQSSQVVVRNTDLVGLLVILAGLGLYRFTSPLTPATIIGRLNQNYVNSATAEDMENESYEEEVSTTGRHFSQQILSTISTLWSEVENQTSYKLVRESFVVERVGDV